MGYLYKYRTCSDFSFSQLVDFKLFYNSPRNYNDPFDCSFSYNLNELCKSLLIDKKFNQNVFVCNYRIEHGKDPNSKEIDKYYNDNFKSINDYMSCINDSALAAMNYIRDEYLCCCFSKEVDNPILWAYYADESKGYALEIDEEILEKEINTFMKKKSYHNDIKIKRINYTNDVKIANDLIKNFLIAYFENKCSNPEFSLRYVLSDAEMQNIFYTKNEKWQFESEFRLIIPNVYKNKKNTEIQTKAIKGIYMGIHVSKWHRIFFELFCKKNNLDLYQMKEEYSNGRKNLLFEQIDLK